MTARLEQWRPDKPATDLCTTCGHPWHGLPCERHTYDGAPLCGCPGPWKANT